MHQNYDKQIVSKTGKKVICFLNGLPMFSRYDPEKEAEAFASSNEFAKGGFFVIAGMGNAYHINALMNKYPGKKILIIEFLENDFLIPELSDIYKKLKSNQNIKFSTVEKLEENICNFYIPVLDGNFVFKSLRSWADNFKDKQNLIIDTINSALSKLKADFSVQSHFGKIWTYNFFSNMSYIALHTENYCLFNSITFPTDKQALVVAAGPSLDNSIKKIKNKLDIYFIIAVDTAYQVLIQNEIIPDVFITIDPQQVSAEHTLQGFNNATLVVADLCSNPAIIKKAIKSNCRIIFSTSNHPLSLYAQKHFNRLSKELAIIPVNAGSGTVTIAGADFAKKAGFKTIDFIGADFAYLNNKPYANGTYLEKTFVYNASRFLPIEKQYCNLMFRTELIRDENKNCFTTEILSSYKKSLDNFINSNKNVEPKKSKTQNKNIFSKENILSLYQNLLKEMSVDEISNLILPLQAWVSKQNFNLYQKNILLQSYNIAKKYITFYTKLL